MLFFIYDATATIFALWQYFWGLLFAFVLTIVIEYFCIIYIVKPKPSNKIAFNLVFKSNSLSYLALIIAPPVMKKIIDLLIS